MTAIKGEAYLGFQGEAAKHLARVMEIKVFGGNVQTRERMAMTGAGTVLEVWLMADYQDLPKYQQAALDVLEALRWQDALPLAQAREFLSDDPVVLTAIANAVYAFLVGGENP